MARCVEPDPGTWWERYGREPTRAALLEPAALAADRFTAADGPGGHPAAGPTLEG